MHSRIPDIPGDLVPEPYVGPLKEKVARLCGLDRYRFPGSQPVSFSKHDLSRLEREDYWVCEKSDGIRVLVYINCVGDATDVYLIDRHDHYRLVPGFYFPHFEDKSRPLRDTICDGELVIDVDPATHQETLRLLLFDCLVLDTQNVMSRPLSSRYGRLKNCVYPPYAKLMKDFPDMVLSRPFDIQVKEMELSYGVEKVISQDIPKLMHGNDGLIYTCAESPYVVGTDNRILKWKPPSENSIDFKLELRFPPQTAKPSDPDLTAKPWFVLKMWRGGKRGLNESYEYFDVMGVDDDEWERLKASKEQVDDRIVEVCWDSDTARWRMLRFRDDKPDGNHRSVVDKIVQSILDGVEQDELIARCSDVKSAWKGRQSNVKPQPRTQPSTRSGPPPRPNAPYGPLGKPLYSKLRGPAVWEGFVR